MSRTNHENIITLLPKNVLISKSIPGSKINIKNQSISDIAELQAYIWHAYVF